MIGWTRIALLVLLGCCLPTLTHAEEGSPAPATAKAVLEGAKRHFEQAVALYNDGDFNAALAEFEASYKTYPASSVLYNIGLTQKALYRYLESITTLERYLAEARSPPRERVAEVRQIIAEMRALLSELSLHITPAGASVVIDGRPVGTAPLDPLSVAAGHHLIEVSAPEYETLRREITAIAGQPLSLELPLKAVPQTGQVRISVTPRQAQSQSMIRVDGQLVGTGVAEVELGAGGHTLEVVASGYAPHRSELAVAAGQRRPVEVALQVEKPPLHRRWWFWTAIGAGVAGGTAAAIAAPLTTRPEAPILGTLSPGAVRVN